MAQDVLRNVTYVLRDNEQIGVVNGSSYSVLFERSNVESLTLDWVTNMLYWIEGGSTVSSENCLCEYVCSCACVHVIEHTCTCVHVCECLCYECHTQCVCVSCVHLA